MVTDIMVQVKKNKIFLSRAAIYLIQFHEKNSRKKIHEKNSRKKFTKKIHEKNSRKIKIFF